MEMKRFWVFGGMRDPFGGYHFLGEVEGISPDSSDVQRDARDLCVEIYESYAGLHGILTWDDVREDLMESESAFEDDAEISDEDVDDAYNEEIDNWCSYWVVEAIPGENPEDDSVADIVCHGEEIM